MKNLNKGIKINKKYLNPIEHRNRIIKYLIMKIR